MKTVLLLLTVLAFASVGFAQQTKVPAGYTYGTSQIKKSPVSLEELKLLQQALLFGEEDIRYLRMSHNISKDQTNEILDVWYGFVLLHRNSFIFLEINPPENQMVNTWQKYVSGLACGYYKQQKPTMTRNG